MTSGITRLVLASLGATLISFCSLPAAFAGGALKHDPFNRPLLSATSPGSPATPDNATVEDIPWNPPLIGIMVAGKNSVINLDGTIMKIGEQKDGYRLVQVKEGEAIFKKGTKRIVLKIETSAVRESEKRSDL